MSNNEALLIKNVRVITETECKENGYIKVVDGKIATISDEMPEDANISVVNGEGLTAIPGFIDSHIHGADGADVMDATPEAIETMAKALPKEGTTSFLATTITQSDQNIEAALKNIGTYVSKEGQAEVVGVHLEGPFISNKRAGAQPEKFIQKADIEKFNHWQTLAQKKIKTITMAPETDPDGAFIKALSAQGINVSAGHTDAGIEEMKLAVSQGVSQVTHIANAMTGIHHRDIGVVGATLLLDQIKAELIADGIHVSPEMIELIYQNIGSERLMLITDALRAKCLPPGEYDLGGQMATVNNEKAVLSDGTLAGSILRMVDAAKNMSAFTEAQIQDIVQMTAVNPAKQLDIFDRKGSITQGKDADIVLIDNNWNVRYTLCRGNVAYSYEQE
ncbi:N-acetylglucosamine-6-phosphate deacetylase [Paraliobacillus sp. PM-2]|uniref:N-acetylglucosamine-6-phosphate deacetylase n=1 Tax=Paraliobacillus sp. PM-2 TaxID=1462524 RepID=UPI00061C1F92|nr:N-acetylglucosamine-6-phosphate deacetylase [Paraliobacillus sp. PM-2]CQR46363.1 N-acetylglucosamine-6-phosphate deacetylase [Paraliobacillus sp. PM-2]